MRLGIMPKAQLISIHALREEGDYGHVGYSTHR